MRLPTWLAITCAVMVISWGAYRVRLGLRSAEQDQAARQRGGLFGMPRRTHVLVGIIYLLMGSGLMAMALGWDPLATLRSGGARETTETPRGDGVVPVQVR